MNYQTLANDARKKVLEMIFRAGTSHIGSNFSVIDILTVLFEKADLTKDKIILSAGWKAAAFYYFLAKKGVIPETDLDTFCQDGSPYIGLTEPTVKGIDFAGGSMGMGFPAAVGFALAKKLKEEEGTVYVIMSDGEMQCGTTWESVLIAAHHKLDNLVVIVDYNKLQAMGKMNEILNIHSLCHKLATFGWFVLNINGHDFSQIEPNVKQQIGIDLLQSGLQSEHFYQKPWVIVADTIKGKGVSFMENNNLWHYKAPNEEEYNLALKELKC